MKKADLDLYTDYLLSTFGASTATGLSAMVDGEVSHDRITRFLSAVQSRAIIFHFVAGRCIEVERLCEREWCC